MLYVKPTYYEKFQCIADKCESTCCAGWQIMIDEDSLHRYKTEQCPYGDILRNRIDWEEGVFKQDCQKRCAFLNDNNLCDMYKNLGEQSLCHTCTNYPRHIEEFENIREITLSISCPEVARIILSETETVTFYEELVDMEEEEFEDFDGFFFSYLEDARIVMLKILQNRGWSISVRTALIMHMAEELQGTIETAELFELADVMEKYEDEGFLSQAVESIEQQISEFHKMECYSYGKAVFSRLYELEHLSDTWESYLESCWEELYILGTDAYVQSKEAFRGWLEEQSGKGLLNMEVIVEQLLVYFVSTYFCGAVYDDNILGKIFLSCTAVFHIYEMFAAAWKKHGGNLSFEMMIPIVYQYSRELEHSDINLELLENIK